MLSCTSGIQIEYRLASRWIPYYKRMRRERSSSFDSDARVPFLLSRIGRGGACQGDVSAITSTSFRAAGTPGSGGQQPVLEVLEGRLQEGRGRECERRADASFTGKFGLQIVLCETILLLQKSKIQSSTHQALRWYFEVVLLEPAV